MQAPGRQTTMKATLEPSSPLIEPLTPREMEVLALLGRHLTNKEIAEELAVSPGTVKTHTLNIYRHYSIRGYRRRQEDVSARR
jgi:DNA-binding CsgD family transcriptional regulator